VRLTWLSLASWIVAICLIGTCGIEASCGMTHPNLEGRQCPCVAGWVCDTAQNVCIQSVTTDAEADGADDAGPTCAVTTPGAGDGGPLGVTTCGEAGLQDLRQSPSHCGVCGHSCRGSACTGGLCDPEHVASTASQHMLALALRDGVLHWADTTNDGGSIFQAFNGGAVLLASFPTSEFFWKLDIDPLTATAYVHSSSEMLSVPLDGGVAQSFIKRRIRGTTHTTTDIYVAGYTTIDAYPKAGGAPRPVVANGRIASDTHGAALTNDEAHVFWATGWDTDAGTVYRYTTSDQSLAPVASGLNRPMALGNDARYLYTSVVDGADLVLVRIPLAGGDPQPIARWSMDPYSSPLGIAPVRDRVLWLIAWPGEYVTIVLEVPACGGDPWVLAKVRGLQSAVVDDTYIYVATTQYMDRIAW
jgi:hypothetical protein